MSNLALHSTPQIQYPLRLSSELNIKFNQISNSTKIPKSTLGRMAIRSLLSKIEERGITSVLNEMNGL